jgi:SPX domain protein involved in polyphosphate accumulation
LNVAWYRAQPYIEIITKDITQASKDIVDFMMFKEYISQLDSDDLHKVYDLFMEKYNAVNESLNDLIQDRMDLKYLRTEAFSKDTLNTELEKATQSLNYSDGNLVFKVMQRYGLMNILTSVQDKMDAEGLNVDNVNEYLSIIR